MRDRNRMIRTAAVILLLATGVHGAMMRRAVVLRQRHLVRLMSLGTVLIRFPNLPLGGQGAAGRVLRRQHRRAHGLYRRLQLALAPRRGSLVGRGNGVRLGHGPVRVREGERVAGVRMGMELVERMAQVRVVHQVMRGVHGTREGMAGLLGVVHGLLGEGGGRSQRRGTRTY